MAKVGIVECLSYEQNEVNEKIEKLLSMIDGLGKIEKDKTVVIKANLVSAIHPDKCATTHPSIVEAVAKAVIGKGAKCIVADSSGGPFNSVYMNSVYKATQMNVACANSGAELNQDFGYDMVENENAVMHKKLPIINVVAKADLVINIAKLKTHTFMGYSGAVKNLFGVIPGLMKVEMHGNFKDQYSFSSYIVDINETIKDKLCLNIIDGVIGMEGEGPTGGTPKRMNCLLASENAYELDVVMQKIMGIDYNAMPLVKVEKERNLLDESAIEIVGDDYQKFITTDFVVPEIQVYKKGDKHLPMFLNGFVHKLLTRRPYISKRKCKGCEKCKNHCPVKAIDMKQKRDGKKYANINYDKCIRCFCCQELCPFHVVKIKSGIGYKFTHLRGKK